MAWADRVLCLDWLLMGGCRLAEKLGVNLWAEDWNARAEIEGFREHCIEEVGEVRIARGKERTSMVREAIVCRSDHV